ncbi:MAG: polyferredoxin [Motiliproteus sp.]|jgi:polyferredoxin
MLMTAMDFPAQKFHICGLTLLPQDLLPQDLLPQDLWILALMLLFFAILLAVVTAVARRVFCGYFCLQAVILLFFSFRG